MDISALQCCLCHFPFTSQARKPHQFPCGHCVCSQCKQQAAGPLTHCGVQVAQDAFLSIDYALHDLVEGIEVPCSQHKEALAAHFCLAHIVALCENCLNRHLELYCETEKPIELASQEVQFRLQEVMLHMSDQMNLSPITRDNIRKGKMKTKNMIAELEKFYTPIRCLSTNCEREITWLNLQGPAFACSEEHKACITDNTHGFFQWIQLPPGGMQEIVQVLLEHARKMIKAIPSVHLTPQNLDIYRLRLQNSEARQVIDLFFELQTEISRSLTAGWPANAVCLHCRNDYSTAAGHYFRLKCTGASHELCLNCAKYMTENGLILTCPVDGMQFDGREAALVLSQAHLPEAEKVYYGPNYVPTQDGRPLLGSAMRVGSSDLVTYTELAPFTGTCHCVVLFPSVIPALGTQIVEDMKSNKGWFVDQRKNPVETIILGSFQRVNLLGFMFSCPAEPNTPVIIDSIKIYDGDTARGEPKYAESNVAVLGGNTVAQDVVLAQPYQFEGQCTVKVKLSCVRAGLFVLFRGNSFERPDLWFSSCGDAWEFNECRELDPGEYPNGQCNTCGPFLRFYYTKV